ncbi:hypothetical protein KX61_000540 [Salmonella enterica subsp. enterica]|nr:hypothetical protein [Salmonella enterica subsp. enterica]
MVWQQAHGVPESFRRGETSTSGLVQVKGAGNQQVQMSRKLGEIPAKRNSSQRTGAAKVCVMYNS